MKRQSALVDYGSSDDDTSPSESPVVPVTKKRRLPTLAPSFTLSAPKDNPALHQGRVRSSPHVEGQFAAYVYIPIKLVPSGSLYSLLRKVVKRAGDFVPILHPIGVSINPEDSNLENIGEREMHISLTRPVYLRAHQRDDFKTALRTIAKGCSPFHASFATFAELTNDERTRTFLTAEIGAGHSELKVLCDAITPVLRTYRQEAFYSEPRFHASIAWALLPNAKHAQGANTSQHIIQDEAQTSTTSTGEVNNVNFPTIPHFPPDMVAALDEEFGSVLRSRTVGVFECEHLCVRIGKDVARWKFVT
ncbi:hypothetical protein BDW22DRAFT_1353253 [Trametopsis cervina]|nr:hypothetical protein BDW22DRAFT_1353253 [Trametopsis cervina]